MKLRVIGPNSHRYTIYFHATGQSKTINVETNESRIIKRLEALAQTHPGEVTMEWKKKDLLTATIPAEWINAKPKMKRPLTEEQRKLFAERANANFAAYRKQQREGKK